MIDQTHAKNELLRMVRIPGLLKIVTANASPNAKYVGHGHPETRVLHDVVRVELGDPRLPGGWWTAFSAEGDECSGAPDALLARLTEHARYELKAGTRMEAPLMVVGGR